jgi:hypothetical protein
MAAMVRSVDGGGGTTIMMVKARGVKIRVESGSSWKLLILNKSGRPFHWGFRPSEFPWSQSQSPSDREKNFDFAHDTIYKK